MEQRNRILIAMSIAMALGYMPWYNFSAVLRYVSEEYGLTPADTGLILSAFQAGYVIAVAGSGWLSDRMSLKKILFCSTLGIGISSTLFIYGQNKWSVLVLRLVTGIAAGAIYVPGMALLTEWFPSSKRGTAIGVYTAALVMAYAGGFVMASHLSVLYGWRTGVLWTSLPAFIGAFLILIQVQDYPKGTENIDRVLQSNGQETAFSESLAAPKGGFVGPALISSGYMGHTFELYAFWGWIGPFVMSSLLSIGLPADKAVDWGGMLTAAIILLGVPSSWGWGIVADKKGRTFAIIVAGVCSVAGLLVLGNFFGRSLVLIALVGGWVGFWSIADGGIYKAGLVEMVSPNLHGFSLGLQSALGFGVTIISPAIFGVVLQWYNGPVDPTRATIWNPSFLLIALGGLIAPLSAFILRRTPQAKLMGGGKM